MSGDVRVCPCRHAEPDRHPVDGAVRHHGCPDDPRVGRATGGRPVAGDRRLLVDRGCRRAGTGPIDPDEGVDTDSFVTVATWARRAVTLMTGPTLDPAGSR